MRDMPIGTDVAHTASVSLIGQYSAANFSSASDGHGGTIIGETPALPASRPRSRRRITANRRLASARATVMTHWMFFAAPLSGSAWRVADLPPDRRIYAFIVRHPHVIASSGDITAVSVDC